MGDNEILNNMVCSYCHEPVFFIKGYYRHIIVKDNKIIKHSIKCFKKEKRKK